MKRIRNWLFALSHMIIANQIVRHDETLTPEYLEAFGWILIKGYYIEPGIKDRDRISVKFDGNFYRVYHSANRTFIAFQNGVKWFETYYLMLNSEKQYKLAKV